MLKILEPAGIKNICLQPNQTNQPFFEIMREILYKNLKKWPGKSFASQLNSMRLEQYVSYYCFMMIVDQFYST